MQFSELKVGDYIRQKSWEDSWRSWNLEIKDTGNLEIKDTVEEIQEILTGYVGIFGFGMQTSKIIKIEENIELQRGGEVYRYVFHLEPPLVGFEGYVGTPLRKRSVSTIASCTWCEGKPSSELGGCGNPCWNLILEGVNNETADS